MRIASIPARLLLAVCLTAPTLVASHAASDKEGASATTTTTATGHVNKKVAQPAKPTWDQFYDMSVNRGFNHDSEEWHQAIVDCLDGKIPINGRFLRGLKGPVPAAPFLSLERSAGPCLDDPA